MKIIIIGAGMSGLTAAAYLAGAGHSVTIYEQFPEPGGAAATMQRDGFGWDLGPLLIDGFGPGDPGRIILEELGVSSKVRALREDRGIVMPGFSLNKPENYEGPYWRRDKLKELFPEERKGLDRYYRFYTRMLRVLSLIRKLQYPANPRSLTVLMLKLLLAITALPVKKTINWSAEQLMEHYFKSPELKVFFLGIVADFVTAPSEFPAPGVPTIHMETAFDKRIPVYPGTKSAQIGYSYILGGCGSLVSAVYGAVESAGGSIRTGKEVKRILIENNRASGVELADGTKDTSDTVIATGGMREVFFELVGWENLPAEFAEQIEKNRLMESILMVQLGIDFDPRPYQTQALCYYYLTQDLEKAVEEIRSGIYHEGRDGFLIYIPSLHSPELAPPGRWAVTVYTVAPDTLKQGAWRERPEELADKLLAEAERYIPGLRKPGSIKEILTPEDFRARFHQKHHSFGGVPPVMGNRPPSFRTPIPGLWFIGAQSESAGGVANVMRGAEKTAKTIIKEFAKEGKAQ